MHQRADKFTLVLRRGGFNLKGFTFSGNVPLKSLSGDSEALRLQGLNGFLNQIKYSWMQVNSTFQGKIEAKRMATG